MELLEGETLYHAMSRRACWPEAEALKLAGRVCQALQYLHEWEIFHRGLKPENIMLCHDGSIRLVELAGRCRRLEPTTPAKRAWRKARLVAPRILIPLALQVLGFLLLWHRLSKK